MASNWVGEGKWGGWAERTDRREGGQNEGGERNVLGARSQAAAGPQPDTEAVKVRYTEGGKAKSPEAKTQTKRTRLS